MSFRVTSNSINRSVMQGLQANLARLQDTQEQLSSGRRINRMSDSPVDGAAAMRLRAEQSANEQVARNIDDGLSILGSADTAFTSMSDMVSRVRVLVVSGLNGTNGPDERAAMATEIDQLKEAMIGQANTSYLGRPIFAGTQNVSAAYDPTGVYLGNGVAVQRSVSPDNSTRMDVTIPGPSAFSTLFGDASDPTGAGILTRISAALRNPAGVAALGAELGNLDAASATMQSARSLVGARYNRLLGVQSAGEARLDSVTANLSIAESIDLPKTMIDMQLQTTAYQAALGTAAKIIQPSLLDFLR